MSATPPEEPEAPREAEGSREAEARPAGHGADLLEALLQRPQAGRFAELLATARRMAVELDRAQPGYRLATNADCARILAFLWREVALRTHSAALGPPRLAALTQLAPALRTIQTRYAERLDVRELAAGVHLHQAYFSALFRRTTGLSPHQYLARFRLHRARELLVSTDRPIGDIALATGVGNGVGNGAYLSRAVSRAEGLSPRAYRRTQRSLLGA